MQRSTALLRFGVAVGPLYFLVSLAQMAIRDGFDLARHPLSALANGPGGWVQTLNLALSGAMVIAAATGVRRALAPRAGPTSWAMSGYGAGMMVAALFPMDPSDGFPVGTPPGMPTTITTSGMVHFAAGGLGFLALAIACVLLAVSMRRAWSRRAVGLSALAGLAIPTFFVSGMIVPSVGIAGIWLSVITQFAWIGILSWSLLRDGALHESP